MYTVSFIVVLMRPSDWSSKMGLFLYYRTKSFQNLRPDSGPKFGRVCRHSSCRQPTLVMSATNIRSVGIHEPNSVQLSVYMS